MRTKMGSWVSRIVQQGGQALVGILNETVVFSGGICGRGNGSRDQDCLGPGGGPGGRPEPLKEGLVGAQQTKRLPPTPYSSLIAGLRRDQISDTRTTSSRFSGLASPENTACAVRILCHDKHMSS